MFAHDRQRFRQILDEIRAAGLWKEERVIQSPYLFSNTLAPTILGASIACLDRLSATTALRDKLAKNG